MPTIVVSRKDYVSWNIGEVLVKEYFRETDREFNGFPIYEYRNADLIVTDRLHIFYQTIEEEYPSDMYIFPSRHRAEKHTKTLTVHPTGNFGNAELGGLPYQLSTAPAQYMLSTLLSLRAEGYETTYEVTHHGPTLKTPTFFVEVGSTEEEWNDPEGIRAVAEAIVRGLEPVNTDVAIGVGGGHYAPDFTRLALKERIAFSHMASKYVIEYIDESMFRQMIERSLPQPQYIKISSLPAEKRREIKQWSSDYGLELL